MRPKSNIYKLKVRTQHNTYIIVIPTEFRNELSLKKGDEISIKVEDDLMYISKNLDDKLVSRKLQRTGPRSLMIPLPIEIVAEYCLDTKPKLKTWSEDDTVVYSLNNLAYRKLKRTFRGA